MTWYLVAIGLFLQLTAVLAYAAAIRRTRQLSQAERVNLPELSLFKPPFLFIAISAACVGTGALLISIFALTQSDPVLLLTQVLTAVIASLLFLRFKPY